MTRDRGPLSVLAVLVLGAIVSLPVSAGSASVVYHGSRARPRVALTFDDGWSRANCRSIAATLRAHDVPATFFINPIYMRADPAGWRRILAGFEVANHTYGHVDLRVSSDRRIVRQIASAERISERMLGRPMLKILRPPFGSFDRRLARLAGSLGYRYVLLWDTSAADTSSSATVSRIIRNATRGTNGSVVLMHCGPSVTPRAVHAIVHSYRSRGYQLVSAGTLLGLPAAEGGFKR